MSESLIERMKKEALKAIERATLAESVTMPASDFLRRNKDILALIELAARLEDAENIVKSILGNKEPIYANARNYLEKWGLSESTPKKKSKRI